MRDTYLIQVSNTCYDNGNCVYVLKSYILSVIITKNVQLLIYKKKVKAAGGIITTYNGHNRHFYPHK